VNRQSKKMKLCEAPPLRNGSLAVWRMDTERAGLRFLRAELLRVEEKARALRFRRESDCRCFMAARIALRRLLEQYTGRPAAELELQMTEFGKPYLPGSPVNFNVSHSGGIVLMAFSREVPVGVDIERVRPGVQARQIARRWFTPEEVRWMEAVPALETARFFELWTRKEALVKGAGSGLFRELNSFSALPDRVRLADAPEAGGWFLRTLDAPPGFFAAAAAAAEWVPDCFEAVGMED